MPRGITPPAPAFPGWSRPSIDFQRVRDGRLVQPLYVDVDLGVARSIAAGTAAVLQISGNFLYVDQRQNTGFGSVHFEDVNPQSTPVTIFAGALWKNPFTKIAIENTAQPGQTLRLIYGVDLDALPISAAGVTVLNAINVNDLIAANCQRIFNTLSPGAGTTVTNIVATATNPNGLVVREIHLGIAAGAGGTIESLLIAAAAAPANRNSAAAQVALLGASSGSTTLSSTPTLTLNRKIPATWGIWTVDVVGVAAAARNLDLSIEVL